MYECKTVVDYIAFFPIFPILKENEAKTFKRGEMTKNTILTSKCSAQHPFAGQNIHHRRAQGFGIPAVQQNVKMDNNQLSLNSNNFGFRSFPQLISFFTDYLNIKLKFKFH